MVVVGACTLTDSVTAILSATDRGTPFGSGRGTVTAGGAAAAGWGAGAAGGAAAVG